MNSVLIKDTTSMERIQIVKDALDGEYDEFYDDYVAGVNFLRDFAASIRNFVGGRSGSYEDELIRAREQAMNEMAERARQLGANAVVGIDIDYEVLGEANGMLMVTASGTAVVVD